MSYILYVLWRPELVRFCGYQSSIFVLAPVEVLSWLTNQCQTLVLNAVYISLLFVSENCFRQQHHYCNLSYSKKSDDSRSRFITLFAYRIWGLQLNTWRRGFKNYTKNRLIANYVFWYSVDVGQKGWQMIYQQRNTRPEMCQRVRLLLTVSDWLFHLLLAMRSLFSVNLAAGLFSL